VTGEPDRFARIREREALIAAKITVHNQSWWHPFRNARLRRECRELADANAADLLAMRSGENALPRRGSVVSGVWHPPIG
jgi:hypothetical protein